MDLFSPDDGMKANIGTNYLTHFETKILCFPDTLAPIKLSLYNQMVGLKMMLFWKGLTCTKRLAIISYIRSLNFEVNHGDFDDCDDLCREISYHRPYPVPFNQPLNNIKALSGIIYHFILIYNNGFTLFGTSSQPLSMEPLVQTLYHSYLLIITGTSALTRTRSKE